jgi:hypothetical protein
MVPSAHTATEDERAGDAQVARRTIRQMLAAGAFPASVAAAVGVGAAMAAVAKPSVTMRGSPVSMERQHEVAVLKDFTFAETPAAVLELVDQERLVPLPGGVSYRLNRVSYPYARPQVRAFVEDVAAKYRTACGEQLVVTSLTRPRSEQPGNAHKLSVHPAGMAVDFRISKSTKCRDWFEKALLGMERQDLLDATRERNPPHYHVAVFPDAYAAWAARQKPAARPAVLAPAPPLPGRAPAISPAAPPAQAPPVGAVETPQTGGALAAVAILAFLALFFGWIGRRLRRRAS